MFNTFESSISNKSVISLHDETITCILNAAFAIKKKVSTRHFYLFMYFARLT